MMLLLSTLAYLCSLADVFLGKFATCIRKKTTYAYQNKIQDPISLQHMFPLIEDNVFTVSVLPHLAWTSSPWLISHATCVCKFSSLHWKPCSQRIFLITEAEFHMCSVFMSFPATRNKGTKTYVFWHSIDIKLQHPTFEKQFSHFSE